MRGLVKGWGGALLVVALAAGTLSGCSGMAGLSTAGHNKMDLGDIGNLGDYTPERALAEARVHFRNEDYGYAAALYKRAVELKPKDPEAYVGLSASYDRLGRFDLSDRVYASLFELSGGTVQYYNNVGYSYMLRGNLTAALSNFRKADKLSPGNVVVDNNLQLLATAASAARHA